MKEENINDEEDQPPNNEQQLNNASTDEPIIPDETTSEVEQPQTINLSAEALAKANYKPETEDMEVHHHAHDPAAPHHKKNWKSYFWEFLMLFLAVFCGFLAEYQLEHYIEKQRAKDFAKSLHSDLVADTAIINRNIERLNLCTNKIDTLIDLLDNREEAKNEVSSIYNLSAYAFITPASTPTESTLLQLLNSGALRYLKDNVLVDSIKNYNNSVQLFKSFSASVSNLTTEFRKNQLQVIEINPLIDFLETSGLISSRTAINMSDTAFFSNRQLLTSDPFRLKEYANWCALKKFYITNLINQYKRLHSEASGVLGLLNKQYHLE